MIIIIIQESCNAGEYALGDIGILEPLDIIKVQQYILTLTNIRSAREKKISKLFNLIESNKNEYIPKIEENKKLEKLIAILIRELRRLEDKILACRFIIEKVVHAPWNTTEAYMKVKYIYNLFCFQ